ncbi:MAG: pilin [Patescibacteria group bacterium]|jgi:hypothetical protein
MRLFKKTKKPTLAKARDDKQENKKIRTIIIIGIAFLLFCFFVNIGYAAIVPYSDSSDGSNETYRTGNYELNDFIRIAFNASQFILGIVGSLTLLMFIYGGVWMIISQGNSQEIEKAKTILKNAVIGLVIVFTSWSIINFAIRALVPDGNLGGKPWYQLAK